MNARLQVEHPVTELVTGVDLVRAQFTVAEEGRLPFGQDDLAPRGHAIELRVNAEDPFHKFTPSIGRVAGLRLPAGPFVRVDTALAEGVEVTPHYDSLLAKLAVWGRTRDEAIERWAAAAAAFEIGGVVTTLPLVAMLAADPAFRAGDFHTGWLVPWMAEQTAPELSEAERRAIAAAAALYAHRSAPGQAERPELPRLSPWVAQHRRRLLRRG